MAQFPFRAWSFPAAVLWGTSLPLLCFGRFLSMGQVQPDVRQLHFVLGLPAPQLFWASERANSLLPQFPSGAPSLRVGERSATSMAQSPSQVSLVFSCCVRPELWVSAFPEAAPVWLEGDKVGLRLPAQPQTAHLHRAAVTSSVGAALPLQAAVCQQEIRAGLGCTGSWLKMLKATTPTCFPFCCRGKSLTQGIQLCSSQPHSAAWLLLWNTTSNNSQHLTLPCF